jgi:DNA repair photolyase
MFNIVTDTWNPISGFLYNCVYCWARYFALTKLRNIKRYSKGFKPSLNKNESGKKFYKDDLIFVSDMGDMFSPAIPAKWIEQVFDHICRFPEVDFLFMTKNPKRYLELFSFIPENAILGVTIETTDDEFYRKGSVQGTFAL